MATKGIDSSKRRYVAGFTIHDAKDISSDGVAIDPLVIVRCLGNEYTTEVKRGKVQHCKFEESYVWNDIEITEAEFSMSYIDFEVQSANVFTRNDVIGVGKVQLGMVRKRPNHSYTRKQLQLHSEDKLTAKLTVSVFVYGEGDKPPTPEDEVQLSEEELNAHLSDLGNAVVGGPGQKTDALRRCYHLFVQVHRAEHLGGGLEQFNPYVSVEFNGFRLDSPPARDTHTLTFDDCFRIPVVTPILADSIVVRVWDKGKWRADQIIVQGRLSFSLLRMQSLQPKWFNFYGFSAKEVGDVQGLLSTGQEVEPNFYNGRLLISARVNKVKDEASLHAPSVIRGQAQEEPPASVHHFLVDVFQVSGCPGSEVYIELSIGKKAKKTKTASRNKDSTANPNVPGRFTFQDQKGRIPPLTAIVPSSADDQLDVMVSLYNRTSASSDFTRIGFIRKKIADIREWKGDRNSPGWLNMRPMANLSNVPPGSVLVTFAKSYDVVLERGAPNVKAMDFHLRCYISQARNLASEGIALPSASCEVSCAGEFAQTETIPNTQNPFWSECLKSDIELQCSLDNLRVYPEPVSLVVYDEVGLDSAQDLVQDAAVASKAASNTAAAVGAGLAALQKGGKIQDVAAQITATAKRQIGDAVASAQDDSEVKKKGKDATAVASNYASFAKDAVLAATGDVIAQKRRGQVVGGRKAIGHALVAFSKLRHPHTETKLRMVWMNLKGGLMGTSDAGDIMVGFELMRKKYVKDFPVKLMKPPGMQCLVPISLIGLRNLKTPDGAEVDKPVVEVRVPSVVPNAGRGRGAGKGRGKGAGGKPDDKQDIGNKGNGKAQGKGSSGKGKNDSTGAGKAQGKGKPSTNGSKPDNIEDKVVSLVWTKKPKNQLHENDFNKKWSSKGRLGYEFLQVTSLQAMIPKFPVYDPTVSVRLLNQLPDGEFEVIGEGSASIVDELPWVSQEAAKKAVTAKEDYTDSEQGDPNDGLVVSDADEVDSQYISILLGGEPAKIAFNKDDSINFPPVVTALAPKSSAYEKGVRMGDWLVSVRRPRDQSDEATACWSAAKAAKFIEDTDQNKIRPLRLVFRRRDGVELHAKIPEGDSGLVLSKDVDEVPPKILRDDSQGRIWKKAGIAPGWRVVDINGTDTSAMNSADPNLKKLLKTRPAVFTCRPHGIGSQKSGDLHVQEAKPVLLSGVSTPQFLETRKKSRHDDGEMKAMRVPRPCTDLPPVVDTRLLNSRAAREGAVDVQGLVRFGGSTSAVGDDDNKNRPRVDGTLEESLAKPAFRNVTLWSGTTAVGCVKLKIKLIHPVDKSWRAESKLPDDKVYFDDMLLRKRFKLDMPHQLRVRCYIVRGLNVSGAGSGFGNPYLYFMYGDSQVSLEGHRFLQSVEPRFFRTEEQDVNIPEQSLLEIGLYDWQENGEDLLIGRTCIDLEDRWFTNQYMKYMKLGKVPIEFRPLISEATESNAQESAHIKKQAISKGSLEMWVELLDATAAAETPVSILFEPGLVEVEVRVVCWWVKELDMRLCEDEYGDIRSPISIRCRCSLDYKGYKGKDPREQETDQHDGCVGEGEFKWRFLYSRIQVNKGAPEDCYMTLSVWEYNGLAKPNLLCESLLDLRSFCLKVALDGVSLDVEHNLQLSNAQLHQRLVEEAERGVSGVLPGDGDDALDAGNSDDDEKKQYDIPPAAIMTIQFQILPQTEASHPDVVVGIGRNDPNRNPPLDYPATGRSWQYTLPAAELVVNATFDTLNSWRKKGGCCFCMLLTVLILYILMNFPKDQFDCPMIFYQSCRDRYVCPNCHCCWNNANIPKAGNDLPKNHFCKFIPLLAANGKDKVCGKLEACKLSEATCGEEGAVCASPWTQCLQQASLGAVATQTAAIQGR